MPCTSELKASFGARGTSTTAAIDLFPTIGDLTRGCEHAWSQIYSILLSRTRAPSASIHARCQAASLKYCIRDCGEGASPMPHVSDEAQPKRAKYEPAEMGWYGLEALASEQDRSRILFAI